MVFIEIRSAVHHHDDMFMSLYTIVDGIFISRFVGSNALSSLNIVFPVITLAIAIGTMFSTGGNAVISKYLGEGNTKRACQCLTQFVLFCVSLSIVLVVLSILFASPISRFLGATDILIDDAVIYLRIVMAFARWPDPSDPVSVLLRNSGTPRHGAWSYDRRRMYQRRSGLRLHRSHAHGDRRSRSGDRHRSVHPGFSRCSVLPVHKKRTPLHPLRILS